MCLEKWLDFNGIIKNIFLATFSIDFFNEDPWGFIRLAHIIFLFVAIFLPVLSGYLRGIYWSFCQISCSCSHSVPSMQSHSPIYIRATVQEVIFSPLKNLYILFYWTIRIMYQAWFTYLELSHMLFTSQLQCKRHVLGF